MNHTESLKGAGSQPPRTLRFAACLAAFVGAVLCGPGWFALWKWQFTTPNFYSFSDMPERYASRMYALWSYSQLGALGFPGAVIFVGSLWVMCRKYTSLRKKIAGSAFLGNILGVMWLLGLFGVWLTDAMPAIGPSR